MVAWFKALFSSDNGQFVYRVFRDAVEAAFAAVVVLNASIPGDLDSAKATAMLVGTTFFAAFVAVIRRELIPWILGKV
jgi:hypothetical protein